jgi:hypothetical protein|nr:MAG TPA: protein of unknown function (DUF4969) [Caudoviricetes sp.]
MRKKSLLLLAGLAALFMLLSGLFASKPENVSETSPEKHLLEPGGVFDRGAYITVSDVEIEYNGEQFSVKNNGDRIVRISVSIVGVKTDGPYEILQIPSFVWGDGIQNEKNLQENGWAVEQATNMVRPGERVLATLSVFDFNSMDENYPKADIDEDGYYDIVFTVSPQPDENTIVTSTSDPVSDVYKIKAE